jgi:hypothetical protein
LTRGTWEQFSVGETLPVDEKVAAASQAVEAKFTGAHICGSPAHLVRLEPTWIERGRVVLSPDLPRDMPGIGHGDLGGANEFSSSVLFRNDGRLDPIIGGTWVDAVARYRFTGRVGRRAALSQSCAARCPLQPPPKRPHRDHEGDCADEDTEEKGEFRLKHLPSTVTLRGNHAALRFVPLKCAAP